jgi:DNA-binding transcriptional ArsR family regulator
MTERIGQAVVDLGWSLWSELGVPGVIRHHAHVAIDPEPLIVFSPWLFRDDARLQEEIRHWCVGHADRISASRLHGLLKAVSPEVSAAFNDMATMLRSHGVLWTTGTPSAAGPTTTTTPQRSFPMNRPALIRLRLRALAGVGARADVLAELLAMLPVRGWLIASDLQHLGYSKRNVARILSELADAGIADTRADKNAVAFRLATPLLAELLQGQQLAWAQWASVFAFVEGIQRLRQDEGKSDAVRTVAAVKAATRFDAASATLNLTRLAFAADDPWSGVIVWTEQQLGAIVDGTSPPFMVARAP